MRILYHHRTLGDGAEGIHIREMISAFQELGHEVRVVALAGESNPSWEDKTSRWALVKRVIPEWSLELAEMSYNLVGVRNVSRAIKQFRPDFVYDRYNLYTNAAVKAARRAGIPSILEVNSPIAYERTHYEVHPLRFPRLANHYERKVFQSADHIFAVSTPLQEYLITETDVPAQRITVLPNGANPSHLKPSAEGEELRAKYQSAGKTVIGYVGSLRPWHGIDLLITAFHALLQQHRDLQLLIVGAGSMENALRQQTSSLGIEKEVIFAGAMDRQEVHKHLSAMDIGVSPRATSYASPMKILEYMAMGLAVVAPRMQNIIDIVCENETALLFEPDDSESLAGALQKLVTTKELIAQLGLSARAKIERQLNWRCNAEQVIEQVRCLTQYGSNGRASGQRLVTSTAAS